MQSPSVAVVIPTYNVEKFIAATLESVFSQTSPADEVIVVDNGSTDKTADIVRGFPVDFLVSIDKVGAGATRNKGIARATSDWIAFLDGDDQFFPEKIRSLKLAIKANPEAVIFAHDEMEGPQGGPFIEKKLHRYHDSSRPLMPQLFERCFLSTSTVAVRRDVLNELGGFNEDFITSQDYELWMRVIQQGPLRFIPQTLALYLLRPQSISDNIALRHGFVTRIIESYRTRVPRSLYLKRKLKLCAETTLALTRKRRLLAAATILLRSLVNAPSVLLRTLT